ncbi:Atu4866 domain-containing protein [Actinoplanes sp. GCM10030250]|uniref:Atu4866 domain-containing protein n=1 Tax=Actinoplanes sp. GCM10030250 TaxID=3273376 RepID=UPI0036243FD2
MTSLSEAPVDANVLDITTLDTAILDAVRDTTVLDAAALLALAMGGAPDVGIHPRIDRPKIVTDTAVVVGAWRSLDGVVRLRLRLDGTYAGEVAGRRRQARGTYQIDGTSVFLHDESGISTPIAVHEGELEMAGHRLLPV